MEQIIGGLENVLYEEGTSFEQLCEEDFLKELFRSLRKIMDSSFDAYIFFIVSSQNRDIVPSSALYKTNKKKVLILISDETGKIPYHLASYYHAIFKAHLPAGKFNAAAIFNFPLSCFKEVPQLPVIPINSRKYTVFFSGNLNKGRIELYLCLLLLNIPHIIINICRFFIRLQIVKDIVLWFKSNFNNKFENSYICFTNGFRQGMVPNEYGKIIADSKIVLCPIGFISPECFRHYEAMRAGCVIISEKLPETYFYAGSPIIQINNWREGLKIVSDLQNNPLELEKISRATQDWWQTRCSENAAAQYMDMCLKQL